MRLTHDRLLDEASILSNIRLKGITLELFKSIASTQRYLQSFSSCQPHVVCAEEQTAGKGRFMRKWYSPFAKNIYLSYRYPLTQPCKNLEALGLVATLSVFAALSTCNIDAALQVKWPNDILYQGKKLAGLLVDLKTQGRDVTSVIIGLGLNVNMQDETEEMISQSFTSLREITGKNIDRNLLTAALINNLNDYLLRFSHEGFNSFLDEWKKYDCLEGKKVILKAMNQEIIGLAKGVDSCGRLRIEEANGRLRAYSSGEVTLLRKINNETASYR